MNLPEHPHDAASRAAITPQLLLGVLVIAAGLTMTLDNLGVIEATRYYRFWPVAIILFGLLKLWQSFDGHGGSFSGFLVTTIGTWLLLEQTAFVRLSFWDMWPTLLVFFGAIMVWQSLSAPRLRAAATDETDVVRAMAVLGSVVRGNNSSTFRGGELTAVLAGCELDLRNAAIDGEAVLEIFALWGGIEIRVPDDWTVVSRVTPVLGGVEDTTRPPQGIGRHRLILRGVVVMAGVEIKH